MHNNIILNRIKKLSHQIKSSKLISIAATIVQENINRNQVAFMALDELINQQNPDDKIHPPSAYNLSIDEIFYNKNLNTKESRYNIYINEIFGNKIYSKNIGDIIVFYYEKDKVLGYINDDNFYILSGNYNYKNVVNILTNGAKNINIIPTKYPDRYVGDYLSSYIVGENKSRFPFLIQNIKIDGESLEIRSESQPTVDSGITIAVINEDGLVVGYASNEWGATLIVVAKEYRGNGLGQILKKIWSKNNPGFTSGGFTMAGLQNLKKYWASEVSEALSSGIYSYAIRNNIITKDKLDKILKKYYELGFDKKTNFSELDVKNDNNQNAEQDGKILIHILEDFLGFILYNSNFFKEHDDKYILGYGNLSYNEHIGWYIYKIEYDNSASEKSERIILECARQRGIKYLYNDSGYSDYISLNGISEVEEISINKAEVQEITVESTQDKEYDYIKINDSTYKNLISEMREEKNYRNNIFKNRLSNEEETYTLLERAEFKNW